MLEPASQALAIPGQQQAPLELPGQGGGGGGHGQISLADLIDMLVQRTYHELSILAELLPRKTDMERKVEIFNFSSRTRMLLVRLLALVKWASSAGKVDKCANIVLFLEKQAGVFLDTANRLADMARETLVRATLPNFHLPAAAEILTTGSYSRVPRCISERILPPAPITPQEKKLTLLRLNQVIESRLVSSPLPLQMRNLTVADGTVTFTVPLEFSVRLTVLGDSDLQPWTVLGVEMLVEDRETGQGKALLHSLQANYVKELVQNRLLGDSNPLHELYSVLHGLAQLLQLEVLHSQVSRLTADRLGQYVRVEEYVLGRALTISYWRELEQGQGGEVGWRLSVQVEPSAPSRPLVVQHTPSLSPGEAELAERSMRTERLSVESLLVHTIYVRTKARLQELRAQVQKRLHLGDVEATLHGSPAVLHVPILQPCLRSEQLLIAIDTHSGHFLAHVPQYPDNPFSPSIQSCLNSDQANLEGLVTELRYWITARRIEKTLQQLPASPFLQLPLVYDPATHPLGKLSTNRVLIKLHRQPSTVLVVEYAEKPGRECEVSYTFHYLLTKPCRITGEEEEDEESSPSAPEGAAGGEAGAPGSSPSPTPQVYLKALGMVEFDPFLVTHGSTTKVDVQELSEKLIGKRKPGGKVEAPIKRTRFPAYFISDLAHMVSFADERIPFTCLEQELSKQGVRHSGTQVESHSVGLAISIIQFPPVLGLSSRENSVFTARLLSATIRLSRQGGSSWVVEWLLTNTSTPHQLNSRANVKPIYSHLKLDSLSECGATVKALLDEWGGMAQVHSLVRGHAKYTASGDPCIVSIQSYTYKAVVLEYGQGASYTATVSWGQGRFNITFGASQGLGDNPHSLVKVQLELHLNRERNLALLGKILTETLVPLKCVSRLPSTPHKWMSTNSQQRSAAIQTFSIVPQTPTHIKLMFYNTHCVDIHMRGDGIVSIRDGSFSMFDQSKVLSDMEPIQGFKAFLYKYVDEAALARRTSQTEDDNPPSPLTMEGESNPSSSLRFAPPHTPPSAPLTPVSPVHGGGAFLQSPPSHRQPSASPSPSPSVFPTPSPAGGTGTSTSAPLGSPFTAASPLGSSPHPRPSPRGPGTPHPGGAHSQPPSRILPQRLWAAAIPTNLTNSALEQLCKAAPLPGGTSSGGIVSPLHRFLGCVFMRRQLRNIIKAEDYISNIESREPGVIAFKIELLQCKVSINPDNSYQSLHLKVVPEDSNVWQPDQLLIIQKFFDTKVVAPPYRPTFISGFCRLLSCHIEPLKNIIQLMRYELSPELVVTNKLKWTVSLCLTIPPVAPTVFPVGQLGIMGNEQKILIFMQLTRANVSLPPGQDPVSLVVPVIYNISQNQTILAALQKEMNNPSLHAVQAHLQNWARNNPGGGAQGPRCSFLPAIHDLLLNLTLPNEGPSSFPQQPLQHGNII